VNLSLKLYFLRHGETIYSQKGAYCGDLDPELTAEGAEMAKKFAEVHRPIAWTTAYVSPMKRTVATAKPLCEALALEMQLRDGLKEIRYGKWEDKTVDFVKEHYWDDYIRWLAEPAWNPPTGGETSVEVSSRASLVIAEIQEKHATGNVLVVSHKATIRIILCSLLGIDLVWRLFNSFNNSDWWPLPKLCVFCRVLLGLQHARRSVLVPSYVVRGKG
jgi:broad specificity phosphatase PhoE